MQKVRKFTVPIIHSERKMNFSRMRNEFKRYMQMNEEAMSKKTSRTYIQVNNQCFENDNTLKSCMNSTQEEKRGREEKLTLGT